MKLCSLTILLLCLIFEINSQIISGKVLSASCLLPIEYVSIGVIGSPFGAITDENGHFKLETKGLSSEAKVRVSMIGYMSQTFSLEELLNKENSIKLTEEAIQIKEVLIKPMNKQRKVGNTDFSFGNCCGWAGTQNGKGCEIGTTIHLGASPVRLKSLHVRVYKQSFDSSLFRLHIRDVVNGLPNTELLSKNIYIVATKKSGWVTIDLSKYNLTFKDEIALTLEWVKVIGLNENRLMKMNGSKQSSANILFSVKRKKACIIAKWGVEDKWRRNETETPSFYLTVLE